ncbi:MAG TPA: AMP-binding protein [Conexibacter sp.]|jgi:2,3-dihydroxybenzoate-AMP ligase|nr:AMP-binding protein [Conexibacter sp.]
MLEGCVPWPAELAERYVREGCWGDETLATATLRWCEQHGERVALIDDERRLTYRQLDEAADALAAGLLDLGLRAGDRAIFQLPNSADFLIALLAVVRIGVLPVLALTAHRERELTHFAEAADAKAYFVGAETPKLDTVELAERVVAAVPTLEHVVVFPQAARRRFRDARDVAVAGPRDAVRERVLAAAPTDAGEVALFLLSGGTTALPKLIPRTHRDYVCAIERSAEICALGEGDVNLIALPAGHNFQIAYPGMLGTLLTGGKVVVTSLVRPAEAFPLIERERVTHTALVPTVAARWASAPERGDFDLSSMRLWQVGGTRLLPDVARRAMAAFPAVTIQQVFGMAEGLVCFTALDDGEDVLIETQGRPMFAADECRIVDAEDRDVAAGERGELITRGPCTLRGYYRAPEHNARAFTADGFYRTGDVVRLHPSGNFVVEGRIKDMINRGGEKISAEEVENLILIHPAVAATAVVAMPHPELTETACAFVTLNPEAELTFEELIQHLRTQQIATFKLPERLELVEQLPLTNVGKVDKATLRARIAATRAGETAAGAGHGA